MSTEPASTRPGSRRPKKGMQVSRNSPNYGKGVVSLDVEYIDEAEVRSRLLEVFNDPKYQPPSLPSVAVELMKLSQDPDVDFPRVVKVLEKDGVLTGEVIKIAQSPLYAGRIQVTSIQQALSRLGLRTLRDIVMQVALNGKVFRAKPYQRTMESLKRHSTAVAHICRVISRYTALEGEYAFLCGLMHDVGIAGALIALAEGAGRKPPPSMDDVWPAVWAVHEETSRMMVQHWDLPPDVGFAVGAHHTVLIQGYPHPMAATLRLADEIAHALSFVVDSAGAVANANLVAMSNEELLDALRLTEKQVELIKEDAIDKLQAAGV